MFSACVYRPDLLNGDIAEDSGQHCIDIAAQ